MHPAAQPELPGFTLNVHTCPGVSRVNMPGGETRLRFTGRVEEWISLSDAAKLLGCTRRNVLRLITHKKLKGRQPAGNRGWWQASFQDVMETAGGGDGGRGLRQNVKLRDRSGSGAPPQNQPTE